MGKAFDEGGQLLLCPCEVASNPSIIHFLHNLFATLLMKQGYFLLVFSKDEKSTSTLIKAVQNVQIVVVIFVFQQAFNRIVMMPSSSMHDDAGRLVNHQKVVRFIHDLDTQVQHWRLYAQRHVHNLIPIPEDVLRSYYLIVDFDLADFNGVLVVLGRVCFELLDKGGQEGLSNPPAFGVGSISIGIRLDKAVREPMNVDWFILLVVILLHFVIVNYFFDKMAQCLKYMREEVWLERWMQCNSNNNFNKFKKVMKESYLRSRVSLQPLNTSDFKHKKQVLDYQDYEEKLSTYEKNKKLPDITDLFDWTKPSEIINIRQTRKNNQSESPVMPNNSVNTEELLRSEEGDPHSEDELGLDDSIDVESPSQHPISKQTYVEQIRSDYGSEYRLMSQIKLENDLKEMRERIIDMNGQLNKMLDRYELLTGTNQKKGVQIANPHKFLSKQIEINEKLIEKQLRHIKQIQEKDKQLQKKDYLVELADLIEAIKKQIHDLQKEKHGQQVDVDKINKLLKEIQQMQEDGEEFKEIKQLKHQIVFYFKKYNEQAANDQQLQKDKIALIQKEEAMGVKLSEMARVAAQNCLQVSTNRLYVQLKRKYDQLLISHESESKKREVMVKTIRGTEEKLQKEIALLHKEIQDCQLEIQEVQYRSQELDQQTKEILANNSVLNRQLKSISYRFDESLIHPEKRFHKPDFKRVLSRMQRPKQANTIDYGALQEKNKRFSINDKNSIPYITESIDNVESVDPSSASRLKPILRSWKSKKGSERYIDSPARQKGVMENGSIFKPGPLLKSKK